MVDGRSPEGAAVALTQVSCVSRPRCGRFCFPKPASSSKRIQSICARLIREFGRATLAPLRRMNDGECEAFLTSLPGVGLKVARCVLVYSLERDVFPVDTHCWRISRRLGWIDPEMRKAECDDEDMERLQAMIPAELRLSLHVNFISLGREVCLDGKPKCGECPIAIFCRYGQQRVLK